MERAMQERMVDMVAARAIARSVLQHSARLADPTRRLDAARELTPKGASPAVEREQLAVCLRSLASLLRDLGLVASRADGAKLANNDVAGELARLVDAFGPERTTRAFSAVDRALAALAQNVNPKVVADWLVLQL